MARKVGRKEMRIILGVIAGIFISYGYFKSLKLNVFTEMIIQEKDVGPHNIFFGRIDGDWVACIKDSGIITNDVKKKK